MIGSISRRRGGRRPLWRVALSGLVGVVMANALLLAVAPSTASALDIQGVCGKRYLAGGDHLPAGHEVSVSERFPSQLRENHLQNYGWCLINLSEDETTSLSYITGGQLSQTWNLRPDLITLTVGEENGTIINIVNSCFDKVKDHDFSGAEASLRRAIMLYPTHPDARSLYGYYLMYVRRLPDLAVESMKKALALDPLNTARSQSVETILYHARRYEEVARQHEHTWSLDADVARTMNSPVGDAYREMGLYDASIAAFEAMRDRRGGAPPPGLAVTYARMGRTRGGPHDPRRARGESRGNRGRNARRGPDLREPRGA